MKKEMKGIKNIKGLLLDFFALSLDNKQADAKACGNRLKILFVCFMILVGSLNMGVYKSVHASGNSYWLAGEYQKSKLIYQGNRLKVSKKWAKVSLKQGLTYEIYGDKSKWKTMNRTLKISPKCIIESGDDEMIRLPYKKYIKKFHISKGDNMTSVSMELKVVKGKVVKIGFYA